MKKFFGNHSKLFGALIGALMSIVLIGGVTFAHRSWQSTVVGTSGSVSVVGTIHIVAPEPEANYDYTISSTELDFGEISLGLDQPILIHSEYIVITNTGNRPIAGLNFSVDTLPEGLTNPNVTIYYDLSNNGYTVNFRVNLSADAISSATDIDLSTMACTITPY